MASNQVGGVVHVIPDTFNTGDLNFADKIMKINKATEFDIEAIISVDQMAAHDENRRRHIYEWVSGDSTVVAVVDDTVVGYAVLEYTFFSQGFISMLIVAEANRRKGVGTALVSHLEKICKTGKLLTSTNKSNEPMQALMYTGFLLGDAKQLLNSIVRQVGDNNIL